MRSRTRIFYLSAPELGLGLPVALPLLPAWTNWLRLPTDLGAALVGHVLLRAGAAGLLALWFLLAHRRTWRAGLLPSTVAGLGLTAGVARLLALPQAFLPLITLHAGPGPAALPTGGAAGPLLLLATSGALLTLLVHPIWAIALGRWLVARGRHEGDAAG